MIREDLARRAQSLDERVQQLVDRTDRARADAERAMRKARLYSIVGTIFAVIAILVSVFGQR